MCSDRWRPSSTAGPWTSAVPNCGAFSPGWRSYPAGPRAWGRWRRSCGGAFPPADAHRTVRTYVSRLRTAGAEGLLVTRPPGYQLRVDPAVVDAVRFEQLAAPGRQALAAQRPRLAVERLTSALGLWRGDVMRSPSSTAIRRSRMSAIEARVEAALVMGLDAQVTVELEGLVRAHPTREVLWDQLMTALYCSGRQAEELSAFQFARGVPPAAPAGSVRRGPRRAVRGLPYRPSRHVPGGRAVR